MATTETNNTVFIFEKMHNLSGVVNELCNGRKKGRDRTQEKGS